MEHLITPLRITGLIALAGAFLYAIGDVLLLAGKVSLDNYPRLKPFAKLLSDAEKMVVLSPNRMIWGALLGVFATPLVLAGFWQVYQGLRGATCRPRWPLLACLESHPSSAHSYMELFITWANMFMR